MNQHRTWGYRRTTPTIDATLGDLSKVRLRVWSQPRETCVELAPTWPGSRAHRLRVRTGHGAFLQGPPPLRRRWRMVAGLPPSYAARNDPFVWLTQRAGELMFHGRPCEEDDEPEVDRGAAARFMRSARAIIRESAIASTRSCDPNLLANIRRFAPCMRWWLYERLERDPTGRLEQLTKVAPGVAVFAFALGESPAYWPVSARLQQDIGQGRPLDDALNVAIADWADLAPQFIVRQGVEAGGVWRRLLESSDGERARLMHQQRLLVRRAMAAVAPTYLLLPPPLRFAPEDIPRSPRANARWFRVMKCSGTTLMTRSAKHEALAHRLSSFASRHAASLHSGKRRSIPELMRVLMVYCMATGKVPSRKTPPGVLVEQAEAWAAQLDEIAEVERVPTTAPTAVLEVKLPVDDTLAWRSPDLVIEPLRTVDDLFREGRRMHNCAASRARAVLSCQSVLCHAEIDGAPHTLEARKRERGWSIVDIRGFGNEIPDPHIYDTLRPWLDNLDIDATEERELAIALADPAVGDIPF